MLSDVFHAVTSLSSSISETLGPQILSVFSWSVHIVLCLQLHYSAARGLFTGRVKGPSAISKEQLPWGRYHFRLSRIVSCLGPLHAEYFNVIFVWQLFIFFIFTISNVGFGFGFGFGSSDGWILCGLYTVLCAAGSMCCCTIFVGFIYLPLLSSSSCTVCLHHLLPLPLALMYSPWLTGR